MLNLLGHSLLYVWFLNSDVVLCLTAVWLHGQTFMEKFWACLDQNMLLCFVENLFTLSTYHFYSNLTQTHNYLPTKPMKTNVNLTSLLLFNSTMYILSHNLTTIYPNPTPKLQSWSVSIQTGTSCFQRNSKWNEAKKVSGTYLCACRSKHERSEIQIALMVFSSFFNYLCHLYIHVLIPTRICRSNSASGILWNWRSMKLCILMGMLLLLRNANDHGIIHRCTIIPGGCSFYPAGLESYGLDWNVFIWIMSATVIA